MRLAQWLTAGLAATGTIVFVGASRVDADANSLCNAGSDEWQVIVDASSSEAAESGFSCNYRIDRSKAKLADGSTKNLGMSGVNITIEYFCSAEEGRERYDGVAGPREEETYRDDSEGVLITEEGTQAANPDNPQADGVYSSFFPTPSGEPGFFGLQEKEWRLLNGQVFATLYVITNERGKVDETERFGVEPVELVARELANKHRGAAPCAIPAVATGGGSTRTGGGGNVEQIILIGTVGLVAGGVIIWRRSGPRRTPKPVDPSVPQHCRGIAEEVNKQVADLETLRSDEKDLGEKLTRAERIHKNNIIKAKIVVNIEIISVIAGTATDLAVALRPAVFRKAGPGALGQHDTWKPPLKVNPKLLAAINAAEQAARTAWSKFQSLAREAERLLEPIEERLRSLPAVKNAQQLWEHHTTKLGVIIEDLAKATAARSKLSELDNAFTGLIDQTKAAQTVKTAADRAAEQALDGLHAARNALPVDYDIALSNVDRAKAALDDLVRKGVEDTRLLGPAQGRLETAETAVSNLSRNLSRNPSAGGAAVQAFHAKEQALVAARTAAAQADANLESVTKKLTRVNDRRQKLRGVLDTQLNNVTKADLDKQAQIATQAEREWVAAQNAGRAELSKELNAARAVRDEAATEAAIAQGLVDDLKGQAEGVNPSKFSAQAPTDGSVLSSVGRAIYWASAPIRYPLQIAGEIVFGVGQSPKEIVDFLVRGRDNIVVMREHLGAVRRTAYDLQRRVSITRRQLDLCIKASVPTPKLPTPGAPAAPAPKSPKPAAPPVRKG